MSSRLILYLLDSPQGLPMQFWSFETRDLVRVGRAPDNDVIVPHPCVSRAHAYLQFRGEGWRVNVLSEQGIIHDDRKVLDLPLQTGCVFRLGPNGPYLRFASSTEETEGDTALKYNANELMLLVLDRETLRREVVEIAAGEYFRNLKGRVRALRDGVGPVGGDRGTTLI